VAEALVADLHGMTERDAALFCGEQLQESLEILRVEALGRHELPEDRPQSAAELSDPLPAETLHRFPRLRQHAPVGAVARGLDRELEAVRHGLAPALEQFGALELIIGRVHLDRGELAGGIFELPRLGQTLGEEGAAPGVIIPAA